MAQQIRSAQQKAALAGQAPPAWAIGAKCQAVYSLDGEWYEAAVVGVTTAGDFVVKFAAYGNTEQARQVWQRLLTTQALWHWLPTGVGFGRSGTFGTAPGAR